MNGNNINPSDGARRRGKGRIALIVICVILALLLLLAATAFLYVNSILNKIPRATEPETTLSPEQIAIIENGEDEEDYQDFIQATVDTTVDTLPTEPVTLPDEEPELIQADHLINILLIGQDRRPGEGRARSDAMVLCTFNLKTGSLTMTSFLRDLYVKIPGYRDNRINASYALGGMKLLNATLEKNFGIHIDGNVEVDFSEFKRIIDLLGGVDITLSESEARVVGVSAGTQHLNGEQALAYSRIRKLDSDFGRTNRQRTVLTALIQAYRNKPLNEMVALLDEILPIVTTDMSNSQILGYVMDIFPLLSGCTITTQHIPASGTYTSTRIRGMAVLYPDLEANRDILRETLLGY